MVIGLTNVYQSQKKDIEELSSRISSIEMNMMLLVKAKSNFLILEPINRHFFESGVSEYGVRCDSLTAKIKRQLDDLQHHNLLDGFQDGHHILDLKFGVELFESNLDSLEQLIIQKGFEDYGLEGQMRKYAHQLEHEFTEYVEMEDVLMLRRHEKDFFLREESKYVELFNLQLDNMLSKYQKQADLSQFLTAKIEFTLKQYQKLFIQIVHIQEAIGKKKGNALIARIDEDISFIWLNLEKLKGSIYSSQSQLLRNLKVKFYVGVILFVLVLIYLSFRLSSNMTKRIKYLSNNISEFVQSNYKTTADYSSIKKRDEVGELAKNMKLLEEEIVVHFSNYKRRAERRTQEILNQKEKIEAHKLIIEEKNKDTLDSIRYARRIQESMLPKPKFLDQLLDDYFVFYRPKDIVSGDFYWVERQAGKLYIAISDCTGHGVPGAFMSIMGNNFLNQAINEKGLTTPNQILSYLNVAISGSLGQNNRQHETTDDVIVQDGMDIVIVVIDVLKSEIQFSGAQRPLLFISEDTLKEFKGDRYPVGGSTYGTHKRFNLETIPYKPGDSIYLFSDGFADQFGGAKNKKFKYNKLKELIFSGRKAGMEDQKDQIQEAFDIWKGDCDQLDDICVFGLRL